MSLLIDYSIDVLFVLILLLTIIISAKKGFFKCLLSLLCVAAAWIAALTLSRPLAEWLYDSFLADIIVDKLSSFIDDSFNTQAAIDTVKAAIDMVPEYLLKSAESAGLDIIGLSNEISGLNLSAENTAMQLSEQIIRPSALVLLKLVCYILIFTVVRVVLGCIVSLIDKLPAPRMFKKANRWLGAALGALRGVVIVLTLSFAVNALSGLVNDGSDLDRALERSRICAVIRECEATSLF